MINIVFLDSESLNHGDLSWKPITNLGKFTTYNNTEPQKVIERSINADIIITNKIRFTNEIFSLLPKLKLLCVAATGYDVIDIDAAHKNNVLVCNCAGYGTNAVAQMAVAHLLEITNHVGYYVNAVKKENLWCNSKTFSCWNKPLMELNGKKVAIVGFGNIGRKIAHLLAAFGMKIYAVSSKQQSDLPNYVTKIELVKAIEKCDVVSLNCPLTPTTDKMINKDILRNVHNGLILINTARGGLVDENAICESLKNDKLGAYCADVLCEEPPLYGNQLLCTPRAYITPHVAWASKEARIRLINILANNIREFINGNPINVVS